MEINHPGAKPLTAEEQALLDQFRLRVDEIVKHRGLTQPEVERLVQGLRAHPNFSKEILATLSAELSVRMPGSRLSFD